VLYAANFRSGKVEVYDTNFQSVTLPAGAFTDPKLPSGFAPFNVQVLGSKVYVTYAKQDAHKHDDVGIITTVMPRAAAHFRRCRPAMGTANVGGLA
jgi:uncharacterized protein (TIGR03118 family)